MNENEDGPCQGRPHPNVSSQVYRRGATGLQVWVSTLFAALADARDELNDDQYRALVEILSDRLGLEFARLVLGEALRARKEDVA
jgi:hypothetical protein